LKSPFIWSSSTPYTNISWEVFEGDTLFIPVSNPNSWSVIPEINDWNNQKIKSLWRSYRPSDVIIPNTPRGGWIQGNFNTEKIEKERILPAFDAGKYGNLSNVWVNWTSVVRSAFFTSDSIHSALTSILNIMNDASGGIWDLQLLMNGLDGRCWRVIDFNCGYDSSEKSNKENKQYMSFDYYTKRGTIFGASITMTIPNALKTTMTIAANADDLKDDNGSSIVDDNKLRAIRGFLDGWADRWRKTGAITESSNTNSELKKEVNSSMLGLLNKPYHEQVTTKEKQHSIMFIKKQQADSKSVSSFYNVPIPLDVSVDLEGLAGIQWGNGFVIKNLPSRYDNNHVIFQVKNVKHTIDTDGWNTELDSVMRVRPKQSNVSSDGVGYEQYKLSDAELKQVKLQNNFDEIDKRATGGLGGGG